MTKSILAFDPSMAHCGWAILSIDGNDIQFVSAGELNLNTKRDTEILTNLIRNTELLVDLLGICWEYNPFNAAHGRSDERGQVIRRGQSGAVGVLKGFAMAHGVKCLKHVNGMTAKKQYAGHGRAPKEMVIAFTKTKYGVELGEHACDAIAVGYTALKRWKVAEDIKQAVKIEKVNARKRAKLGTTIAELYIDPCFPPAMPGTAAKPRQRRAKAISAKTQAQT